MTLKKNADLAAKQAITLFSNPDIQKRFWNKVNKTNECWIWNACKNKQGYGIFGLCGSHIKAHRAAYFLSNNYINDDVVMHICDNPSCVNPKHLRLGTQQENIKDMNLKGRQRSIPKYGEDNPRSILTNEKVLLIREEKGTCKTISKKYGVSLMTISRIKTRKLWKHL